MTATKENFLKVWIRAAFLSLIFLCFSSCQKSRKPSFIVIAADKLSFNSFSCNEDKGNTGSGLSVLCQEAIRYTNAYTTSTQPAAAMASLLTGTYPFDHGLHRSFDRVDPSLPLIQEFFKASGYRTAFWGSKPSLLKKTGLSRGFEVFDDYSFLDKPNYTLDFNDQIRLFENWAADSADPFFSVIYSSDLELLNEGQAEISSLESFDERLGVFISNLKKNNLWETNYIVVLGLQGKSEYGRIKESVFSNLHSENTNIAFFIKPPRQKGDEGVHLKVDNTTSIADFGYSLIKIIKPDYHRETDSEFPLLDFSDLWLKNQVEGLKNRSRKIILESANTWSENLEVRFALVLNNYLYLEAEKDELYNRLTDGLETIDIMFSQSDFSDEDVNNLSILRQKIKAIKWQRFQPPEYKWVISNREYWAKPNNRREILEKERKRLEREKKSQPLSTLLMYFENPKKEKDLLYEEARRVSLNLSLENIWGLWNPDRAWPHPSVTTDTQ
jgi:hypothetical protein